MPPLAAPQALNHNCGEGSRPLGRPHIPHTTWRMGRAFDGVLLVLLPIMRSLSLEIACLLHAARPRTDYMPGPLLCQWQYIGPGHFIIRQCRRRRTSRRGRRDQTFRRALISVRPRCQDGRVPDTLQKYAGTTVASITETSRSHDGPSRISHVVGHTYVDRNTPIIVDRIPNNATSIDFELFCL